MKKLPALVFVMLFALSLCGCGETDSSAAPETAKAPVSSAAVSAESGAIESEAEDTEVNVKITVGDTELLATLENNATTRAIVEQMPMTIPMMDLYGREMCYRYGAYALPTENMRSDGYEVGDIAYWAPGGSLVILYAQNGEQFERQHLGHIDSGVEVFESTGDVDVTFELMD
ncbi:MAG: cyclophilin-like fold protein [Eggerthellaceae bacterium]|nr:cyclophilin-like fold protein [Eggerthellaceae bacterium]